MIMDKEINKLELDILSHIAEANSCKYLIIKDHIPFLVVNSRVVLTNGIRVKFEYTSNVAPILKDEYLLEALLSAEKTVVMSALKNGLGYVLDIEEGLLTSLEIFTNSNDEKWDGSFGEFEFIDKK